MKTIFSTFLCDHPSDKYASVKKLAALLSDFGLVKVQSPEDL